MTDQGQLKEFSFPKTEKLTGKKRIEELFRSGSSFYLYPFLLRFIANDEAHHRVVISVSKKKVRKAVKRNLIKRRIREAYRLNKSVIPDRGIRYDIAIIYLDKTPLPFVTIREKLVASLSRFTLEKKQANE